MDKSRKNHVEIILTHFPMKRINGKSNSTTPEGRSRACCTASEFRNLEMSIRFSLKSRPYERFHWPEMSQIKAEISLRTNVKLIFHKNVGLQ